MNYADYIAQLEREAAALAFAARAAAPDTPVPSCPEWAMRDLVAHTSRAHRWSTANLEQAPGQGPASRKVVEPEAGDEVEWFEEGASALASALRGHDPTDPAWTFAGDAVAGFWARRQAHETLVHRWDAERAAGRLTPIDGVAAADAIDEYLMLLAPVLRARGVRWDGTATAHFHCTDAPGEWMVRLEGDEVSVTREHAKGDVAATGPAADLMLLVYNRLSPADLQVFGDTSVLDRWRATIRF